MVEVRPPSQPPNPDDADRAPAPPDRSAGWGGRLNLLLTYAGWQEDSWVDRLPRLLEPLGVRAWRASSGHEASRLIRTVPVHIAVVDLALPFDATPGGGGANTAQEGGPRILELLARLEQPPPTVVVKRRRTQREDARQLSSALSAGAFAVLDQPVQLETALEVMRRVLCRHYADRWPGACPPTPNPFQAPPFQNPSLKNPPGPRRPHSG
jgi:CheY-like chemotaxis protein